MNKIYVQLICFMVFLVGCESIEDTYSRFSDEGMIRYVGKCNDLKVMPGWERVELAWTNSIDPTVEKIKIVWKTDDQNVRDTLIAGDVENCNIKNLLDGVYTFEVYAVDYDGNCSLAEIGHGRPYSYVHEEVIGFSKVVTKYFQVKNNVILFFDRWQPTLKEVTLSYYRNDQEIEKKLTETEVNGKYFVLREIDIDKPIIISRIGTLAECPDEIVFEPTKLDLNVRTFTNDFSTQVKNRYQVNNINEETFFSSVTELELDRDLKSLEDILYFPNWQKVVLGKNRYMDPDYVATGETKYASTLEELEKSLYILDLAYELAGVTVECYNGHYISDADITGRNYIQKMGNPKLPVLNYLNTEGWTISATVEDETGYDSHMEYLLDNNPSTIWKPRMNSSFVQTHELTIDMKTEKTIKGFKIAQKAFVQGDGDMPYLPVDIKIQTSSNSISWNIPLIAEENVIGNSPGEITVLELNKPITARYIRIKMNDVVYFQQYNTLLGDFVVFE